MSVQSLVKMQSKFQKFLKNVEKTPNLYEKFSFFQLQSHERRSIVALVDYWSGARARQFFFWAAVALALLRAALAVSGAL